MSNSCLRGRRWFNRVNRYCKRPLRVIMAANRLAVCHLSQPKANHIEGSCSGDALGITASGGSAQSSAGMIWICSSGIETLSNSAAATSMLLRCGSVGGRRRSSPKDVPFAQIACGFSQGQWQSSGVDPARTITKRPRLNIASRAARTIRVRRQCVPPHLRCRTRSGYHLCQGSGSRL